MMYHNKGFLFLNDDNFLTFSFRFSLLLDLVVLPIATDALPVPRNNQSSNYVLAGNILLWRPYFFHYQCMVDHPQTATPVSVRSHSSPRLIIIMKLSSAAASILFATCGGVSTMFNPSSFVAAKEHSPPPRLIVTSSNTTTTTTTTNCPSILDFATRGDIKCNTVASMEWFLTTKEGIESLQGLTKGLRLEQIRQPKGTKPNSDHDVMTVSSVVGDEDEIRPLNSNNSKNKKSSSDKGGVPTVTPISPYGETVSSKCSPYLKDPLIDCETIGSMLWFLTTDEGIASLQGMVDGMEAERIVQRHAIISIFKDFNMMMTSKESEHRELGISFITTRTFDECDMEGITCNSSGKITKIELSKC